MKTAKKLVVLVVVLAMFFALGITANADTSGYVNVTFLVPMSYTLPGSSTPVYISQPSGYSISTTFSGYYEYTVSNFNLASLTNPFTGGNDLNVFDVFFSVVTAKGESIAPRASAMPTTQFVYFYDTDPNHGPDGYVIDRLSGLGTDEAGSNYSQVPGASWWAGLYWSSYGVPSGVTYDVTHPVPIPGGYSNYYQLTSYTSNTEAEAGYTYYMVYEYSEVFW